MAALQVTVHATSRSPHTGQIDAGFALLAAQGTVRVRWTDEPHPATVGTELTDRPPTARHALVAEVEGRTVAFETRDHPVVYPALVDRVDVYAKRSLVPGLAPDATAALIPLGLNMPVGLGPHTLGRRARLVLTTSGRAALGRGRKWIPGDPLWDKPPDPSLAPRVLFMARLWDPDDPGLSPTERDERVRLNDTRAAIVRALRAALGDRFVGGIEPGAFASRHYGDVLLPADLSPARGDYLSTMTAVPIAVATTGLHGSQGWKLAEYVAAARAIVSERTDRVVPGPFGADRTLIEFGDVDGCVAACERLLGDGALRTDLMHANADYWQRWLRPDRLVRTVLEHVAGPGS